MAEDVLTIDHEAFAIEDLPRKLRLAEVSGAGVVELTFRSGLALEIARRLELADLAEARISGLQAAMAERLNAADAAVADADAALSTAIGAIWFLLLSIGVAALSFLIVRFW